MTTPSVPAAALHAALRDIPDSVVLRNHDIVSNLERGGDVDLLVHDLEDAERCLRLHLGPPAWTVRRSYVRSLFYLWGHIDLVPDAEWHGARYLDTATVLRDKEVSPPGLWVPRLAHEAVISWFSSLLWGGFFKDRYREMILNAARLDATELFRVLQQAVGRRWANRLVRAAQDGKPEISEGWGPGLRRHLWCRQVVRHPHLVLSQWVRFWLAEVLLRLRPPLPWLAVLGPDGSGKTTVLEELEAMFPRPLGGVRRYHWRPGLVRGLARNEGPVTEPHARPPRAMPLSIAKLVWLVLDWQAGYWLDVVHHRAKARLVVFDRHFIDLLADPRRYRSKAPGRLVSAMGKLVPEPDLLFVLDAPVDVLHSRKREVSRDEALRQREAYRQLADQRTNAYLLDATLASTTAAETILKIVLEYARSSEGARSRHSDGGAAATPAC